MGNRSGEARLERQATVLALIVAVIAVGSTVGRVFFGADFLDEALYAAVAYRFAMGTKPLLELSDPHQLAFLLTAPYVKLHLLVFGDTEGILLSLRLLWVVLNGVAAGVWFTFLRKVTSTRLALLAAVTAFSFIPYMIPAPSFNTLPVIFGALAMALLGFGMTGAGKWTYFAAGAFLGLATLAYPTLVVSSLLVVAGVWWLVRSWREPALVAAGGFGVAAVALAMLVPYLSGLDEVLALNRQMASVQGWLGAGPGGLFGTLQEVVSGQATVSAQHLAVYPAVVLAVLAWRGRARPLWITAVAVGLLPVLAGPAIAYYDVRTLMLATSVLIVAALGGLVRSRGSGQAPAGARFLRFAIGYGVVSGLVCAVTSTQTYAFLALGALPVMAPALALLFARLDSAVAREVASTWSPVLTVAVASCLALGLVAYNWTGFYRDEPPGNLSATVKSGPHKGLRTTEANARNSESLWEAMRDTTASDRVLSYHGFPAGYLYTPAKPSLDNLWLQPYDLSGLESVTDAELETLQSPEHMPTVVIRNQGWPNDWAFRTQNPSLYDPDKDRFEAFVEENYRLEHSDLLWVVLVPR